MDATLSERNVPRRRVERAASAFTRQLGILRRRSLFRGYQVAYATTFAIIGGQIVAAYIIGRQVFDIGFRDVIGMSASLQTWAGWLLLPLLFVGLVALKIVLRRKERPTVLLLRWLRFRADWLLRGFLIVAAYPTMGKSFTLIKASIPKLVGFFADPMLIKWDQAILGTDAWTFFHSFLPVWFLIAIDRVYIVWFTYLALMTGVFSFTRDPRFQARSVLSFFLCWTMLGIFCAYGLASVGPVFYDSVYSSQHFEGLLALLEKVQRETGLVATKVIGFLLSDVGKPKLGMGISAMPSMHVSVAYLGFLMSTHFRGMLWLKIFTFAFTVAILLGSVLIGWHYLVDGLFAIVGTTLIWYFARWFVDRTYIAPDASQDTLLR